MKLFTDTVDSYEAALHIVTEAANTHSPLQEAMKDYEDHLNGKRPINPEALKKKKMSWASNWNFGKARAKVERAVAESVAIAKNSIFLCQPELGDKVIDSPFTRGYVENAIASILYKTLQRDARFEVWINQIEYQSFFLGYSSLIFDDYDFLGYPIHPKNIAFPEGSDIEGLTDFVIFDEIKAINLYERWEKTKEDPKDWNIEALEAVLEEAYKHPRSAREQASNTTWQQRMAGFDHNPYAYIKNTQDVKIAKLFHKDLDGSWKEIYIPYDDSLKMGDSTKDLILFKRNHGKIPQSQLLCIVKDSGFSSSGSIDSYRGIAKYAVEDSVRHNRKRNDIENKLKFAGSPMFSAGNLQNNDTIKIGVSQGYTLVDSRFQPLEKQPQFDLSQHIMSMQIDEQNYLRDTIQYDAKLEGRLSSRPTNSEIQAKGTEIQAAKMAKNNVKLSDYARLIKLILKRLASIPPPEAGSIERDSYDYFFDELAVQLKGIAEGKSDIKKILKDIINVVVDEPSGNPQAIQVAMQVAETPYARTRLKRMLLLANGFSINEVMRSIPFDVDSYSDLNNTRFALIENNMFWETSEVVVNDSDDDISHLSIHHRKINSVIGQLQQGQIDPVKVQKFIANALVHSDAHLVAMEKDASQAFMLEEMQQAQDGFVKVLNQVNALVEEQQRNQPPPMSEAEQKNRVLEFNAMKKAERTEFLTQQSAQKKRELFELDKQIAVAKNEVEMQNMSKKGDREVEIKTAKEIAKTIS